MTLDGISGIKLFEKFKMSKGVLPLTYDEGQIALIVKAISHTVDTKQWTTKIETMSVPEASGSLKTYSPPPNPNPQTNTSTSTTAANSKMSDFTFGIYPNWVPTVKGSQVTVTSLPAPNRNINGEIKNHYGVDIAGAIGTRIISPVDGVVRNGLFGADGGGYGDQFVIIQENGTRNFHIFGHNNTREGNAKINGNQIKKGEIIATMGNKGHSTGPHLHYEIRKGSVQNFAPRLDPIKYLNSFPSLSLAAVKKSEKTYS
jgi:murein DD-endopeptidase MepM/ murein hydrolase activator NlpD